MLPIYSIESIPVFIDDLKKLMGIKLCIQDQNHPLFSAFLEYEKWQNRIVQGFFDLPPEVQELASHAAALHLFKTDWDKSKVRTYVANMLNNPDHTMGILFEFTSAVHFLWQHREVHWLPNIGNNSEYDLEVTTNGGAEIRVECTRKREKPGGIRSDAELVEDVGRTFASKQRQVARANRPLSLAVYFPEKISWAQLTARPKLESTVEQFLKSEEGKFVSVVLLASFNRPIVRQVGKDLSFSELRPSMLAFRNGKPLNPLPQDFKYMLTR